MNLRRSITSAAALLLVVGSIVIGSAVPASASPLLRPTCATMLGDPAEQAREIAWANGVVSVPYHTPFTFYGSDNSALVTEMIVWHGTSCSWSLRTTTSRNFSVTETPITSFDLNWLRNWYASHGIVGDDATATLGGYAYQVSPNELDVLWENRVWIAITSRHMSVESFTMQNAGNALSDLNPWA